MATQAAPRARLSAERRFFTGMALALAATVFIGFAPTYYVPAWSRSEAIHFTPALHVHAALNTAWMLLFAAQAGLVAARRTDIHRVVGVAGAGLAAAVFVSGIVVALYSQRRIHTPLNAGTIADPYVFLIFPFFAVGLFALLVAAGVAWRRRSDYHKRLMLLATMSLAVPAIARIVRGFTEAIPPVIGALILVNLFLAALVLFDWRSRGRLHPATLWAGGLLLLSEPLRVAIGYTRPWQQFAEALMT